MLTPPVAIASMVAAEMAGADMWKTGFIGVQLAATAYLLPYLWAFNPALILEGTTVAIIYAITTAISGGFLLAHSVTVLGTGNTVGWLSAIGMYIAALVVGSSTIWLGVENPLTLAVAAGGMGVVFLITKTVKVLEPTAAE
jgi:TRAP-type uncharacterized transport system fused permease subunit